MIYLDQAATSFPKIKEVQDAVIDCMIIVPMRIVLPVRQV